MIWQQAGMILAASRKHFEQQEGSASSERTSAA
jgi:hypothetical protein